MQYFVIAPDGQKYGPADVQTLNQWAIEGRVSATSMLEDLSSGARIPATSVQGIVFPMPTQNVGYSNQSNYPRGPQMLGMDNGEGDLRTAWTFAIIGIVGAFFFGLCCSWLSIINVFSILGIVFASNAKKKGNPNTKGAMACSIIGVVLGPVIFGGLIAFFQWMK